MSGAEDGWFSIESRQASVGTIWSKAESAADSVVDGSKGLFSTLSRHSRTSGVGPQATRMDYKGIDLSIVMPHTKAHALLIHKEI